MVSKPIALAYGLTAALVFAVSLLFALRVSPTYMTDALLIPKAAANTSQLSGGLASASRLLGINPVSTDSTFSKFQKYWASRDVAQGLINKYPTLLQKLFAYNWDAAHHQWYNRPHTLRQIVAIPLDWLFGVYPNYQPTALDLAAYIKQSMVLDQDPLGTQIGITYKSDDARFAQWFLGVVITGTDAAVRAAEQRHDKDFISFIRNRLAQETNVGYRDALTNSLDQFEISSMYSQAGDNFSFQYVEPPNLPVNHISPQPLTDTTLAFLFANLVAASIAGAMKFWPDSRFGSAAWDICDTILYAIGGISARSPRQRHTSESHGKADRRAI